MALKHQEDTRRKKLNIPQKKRERETKVAPIPSPTPSPTKDLSFKETDHYSGTRRYSSVMNSISEIFWNRKKTKTKSQANSVQSHNKRKIKSVT